MEECSEENDEIFALVSGLEKNEQIVHELSPLFLAVHINSLDCNMFIAGGVDGLLDVPALALPQHLPQFEFLGAHVELVLRKLKTSVSDFNVVIFEKYVAFSSKS
jgi:hypothetical protein